MPVTSYGKAGLALTLAILFSILLLSGCADSTGEEPIVVNSLNDTLEPAADEVTMRLALELVGEGGRITFADSLDGGVINLTIVGDEHSILKGEVYQNFRTYLGIFERDYGRSALYTDKDVIIDASNLPEGITLAWSGEDNARVMAVFGDLTLINVDVTGGFSEAAPLEGDQPWTLARGGGLAVWGIAAIKGCALYGNRCVGDSEGSRDRGTFGGGIYADVILMEDSVVSGNRVEGYGGSGGGVFSVGGAEQPDIEGSVIRRSSISGNRVTAEHAYGGGVYSDGGSRGFTKQMSILNTTIARNIVEDNPAITDQSPYAQFYYRGGGLYYSNGNMYIESCTIVENEVTGNPYPFSGKPNMGGGGICATIGDAHTVEKMEIMETVVAGNTVNDLPEDIFTGSLVHFLSYGYNLLGAIDFSQILVPVPSWSSLNRRHYPMEGDADGVDLEDAVDLGNIAFSTNIISTGVASGDPAPLWYPPGVSAIDAVPEEGWVNYLRFLGYRVADGGVDDFLPKLMDYLRSSYGDVIGNDFGVEYDTSGLFYGPAETWPSNPENEGWITFWQTLDADLGDSLGTAGLGESFWQDFPAEGFSENLIFSGALSGVGVVPPLNDQLGESRPVGDGVDIGAIELPL
ncbi:MAG: hypothetical protein C0608_00685 [Deltaproteobacteria bacterium]|nr:MAG: hypothetical protein C0608_00685 [Deltaproteobacteria bacterium]